MLLDLCCHNDTAKALSYYKWQKLYVKLGTKHASVNRLCLIHFLENGEL